MPTPLTTAQLAAKLGVSRACVSQWVAEGRITPLYRLGVHLFDPRTKRPTPRKRGPKPKRKRAR